MLGRYRDVFASLDRHNVEYVVIGGIAVVMQGVPRATFDLDILIRATEENAQRMLDAFLEAGLGAAALTTADDVVAHEVTIFADRVRIDVQTFTPGIEFEEAWARKVTMAYHEQSFHVLCIDDLIASKRAAGRPVDLDDAKALEERAQKPE